jgi:4-carboxymuconolactone decarboxylase
MKTISATALVLCLSAAACSGVAVSPREGGHLHTAPIVEDVRAVSPALARYTEGTVRADLWCSRPRQLMSGSPIALT